MTHLARLGTTTALVTLISSTPALADITADDVWDSLTAVYQAMGLDVEATQQRAGNILSLENLKASGNFPFDLGSVTLTTTGFDLVENSNGTVSVEFPDNMPLAIALTLPDDMFVTATLDYRTTGYRALASGDPGNITTGYSADSMVFTLTDFNVPDLSIDNLNGTLTFNKVTGSSTVVRGEMLSLTEEFSSAKTELDGGFTNAEDGLTIRVSEIWNVTTENTKFTLPASGIDLLNLPAQLRSGLSMQYVSTQASTTGRTITTLDGKVVGDENISVSNNTASISVSQNGFTIDATASDYDIDYLVQEMPFPIQVEIPTVIAKMGFPLLSSPGDQDIAYTLSIRDLTMNEEIWAQFDPTGSLPHDPASLTLDLSGKGKLFIDLLDFEAMQKVFEEGVKFGELTEVSINNLDMSAVGASMTGTGGFTFDNSDLETYDGFPAPSGATTFNIVGLNALMDKLIALDLLPDDAAMGIRMGLSLLAVAGDGEDTLVSDIKITPDGQITANGKRLK